MLLLLLLLLQQAVGCVREVQVGLVDGGPLAGGATRQDGGYLWGTVNRR